MQFKLKEFFLFCLIIKINTDNILDDNEEISSNLHLDNSYFNQNLIRETKFSFLEQNLRKTILDYDDEDFRKLLKDTIQFIQNITNTTIIESFINDTNCINSLSNYKSQILHFSGKSINDLGSCNLCYQYNMSYFIVTWFHNDTLYNHSYYKELLSFFKKSSFITGICMIKNCSNILKQYFKNNSNPEFFIYLSKYGILNVEIDEIKKHDNNQEKYSIYFKICGIIFIVYSSFILLNSIMGRLYFNYLREDDGPVTVIENYNQKNSNIFSNFSENTKWKEKHIWYKIFKFFSVIKSIKFLIKEKNTFYDNSNLQVIDSFRVIFLFLFVLNQNYYTLEMIPNRFSGYNIFLQSTFFSFVKYSTFSCDIIILLDGFILSYKYFNFVKKYESRSLINHLIFFGNVFTKTLSFYFIFCICYLLIDNFVIMIEKSDSFPYLYKNKITNRVCYHNPSYSLIPFYLNYLSYNSNSQSTNTCYRFFMLYSTQVGCMIIILTIFYLSGRLRSSTKDLIISIVILIIGFFSYFFAPSHEMPLYFTNTVILGDNTSYERIEIMFGGYFYGILGGIIYFYYCDVISENQLKDHSPYIPFQFCYVIMNKMDRIGSINRNFFIILTIIIKVFLCFTYTINFAFINNGILIPFNSFYTFLFYYEKKIFQLSYLIFMLLFLISVKSQFLKSLLWSNWTKFISRLGFVFLSNVHSFTYLFYSIYDIEFFMNLKNLFLFSIGLFVCNLFASLVIVILFEIPLRILYKKFTNWFLIERKKQDASK